VFEVLMLLFMVSVTKLSLLSCRSPDRVVSSCNYCCHPFVSCTFDPFACCTFDCTFRAVNLLYNGEWSVECKREGSEGHQWKRLQATSKNTR